MAPISSLLRDIPLTVVTGDCYFRYAQKFYALSANDNTRDFLLDIPSVPLIVSTIIVTSTMAYNSDQSHTVQQ